MISFVCSNNIVLRVLFAIVENCILAVLLYEGSFISYSAYSILFYVMAISCDLLSFAIQKRVDPDLRIESLMQSDFSVYMGTLSQLLQMTIIFVLKRLFAFHKNIDMNSKMWVIYLVFPIYSLVIIVLEGYSFSGTVNSFQTNTFTFIAVSLLGLNMFVYWFIRQEMNRRLTAQKDMIEISHAKEIIKLYNQMSDERNILGKREHEYKNMVTATLNLARNGRYDEVIKILESQNTELVNNTNVVETGNPIISAIINNKYSEARSKDINVRLDIGDLSTVKLDERDSIVVISNILNNAIEAAEKCMDGNRYINIKAVVEDEQFIFAVHNSCVSDSSDLMSHKVDVIRHGYGLENIREVVERNQGNCFFENKDGEFVSVVIFLL